MHVITLFWVMNPHQRCLHAKVKYRNEPKQLMPKSEDLSRSLEINASWTFDTEFPTIFNKSCTYITFKSAVKHRQQCHVNYERFLESGFTAVALELIQIDHNQKVILEMEGAIQCLQTVYAPTLKHPRIIWSQYMQLWWRKCKITDDTHKVSAKLKYTLWDVKAYV